MYQPDLSALENGGLTDADYLQATYDTPEIRHDNFDPSVYQTNTREWGTGYGQAGGTASSEMMGDIGEALGLVQEDIALAKEDVSAIRALAEKDGLKKEYYLGGINFSNIT